MELRRLPLRILLESNALCTGGDSLQTKLLPLNSGLLLRSVWQRIFHRAWIASLVLFVALGCLRTYGLLGPSSARGLLVLNFLLMWCLPFILFTKKGRQAMGLKRVEHRRWLGWGLCLGMGAALIVFAIGWALYGRSADNWYISVLNAFSIGATQMHVPRLMLFLIYTLPAMIFSPVGEEFFFRGILHESVKEQWGPAIATAVNATAFGGIHLLHHGLRRDSTGAHLLLGSGLLWVGLMSGLSWLFTVCRQRGGSIWPAVVAHSGFNLMMNLTIFLFLL